MIIAPRTLKSHQLLWFLSRYGAPKTGSSREQCKLLHSVAAIDLTFYFDLFRLGRFRAIVNLYIVWWVCMYVQLYICMKQPTHLTPVPFYEILNEEKEERNRNTHIKHT